MFYHPSTATWRLVTDFSISSWGGPQPFEADSALLLIDPYPDSTYGGLPMSAILDIASETWRLPSSEPPSSSAALPEVWTGSMVLFPGSQGVAYDPAADVWYRLPDALPGSVQREQIPTVWAGDRVLIWSGTQGESSNPHDDGVAYIPG